MGLLELLACILVVLKLAGATDMSWFYVLLPEIVSISIDLVILFSFWRHEKKRRRGNDDGE